MKVLRVEGPSNLNDTKMLNPILSNWEFALFSANIHKFIPSLSWEAHDRQYHTWRAFHERGTSHPRQVNVIGKESLRALPPGILTLFHLGSHLESPIALAASGLVFDIILEQQVYNKSQNTLDDMLQKLNDRNIGRYNFLFSDDPKLLLRCRSSLKNGNHILVFADGSSGTNLPDKDVRVKVPFLAGTLNCKQGIPRLAYLFNVPIYGLLPCSKSIKPKLRLQCTIFPKSYRNRNEFTVDSLTRLYKALEIAIQDNPWRWECWSYLHRNGMLDMRNDFASKYALQGPYLFVQIRNAYFVFDRRSYCAQELNLS